MTSDSSALVLVTPIPSSRELNRSEAPRSFGRSRGDGPGRRLHGERRVAVALPLTNPLVAGVAIAAQELGDLRLQDHLEKEADAQPGYLLEDLAELPAGVEQLIELGTEAFAGGYSS